MLLKIKEPYLWLPVEENAQEYKLHFYIEKEKIQEIDIHLGKTDFDFYACLDVSEYLNKSIEIEGAPENLLQGIFCAEEKPQRCYPFRPKIHFAPEVGWHNDPNGMIYDNGQYHLYYQWNPYGTIWGNMHWGHAKSKDMFHWEQRPMALAPNDTGTMYSGCAIRDYENHLGYGKDAVLFYYTAAGGKNEWSEKKGSLFTQRLAYSVDDGETLLCSDKFFMPHIINENRDPKVFYHEPSKAYIMVLYLDGNEFAIYRSENLIDWEETQRFEETGMWECPDLFELEVKNSSEEKLWVFWSADGYYVTGKFDGYKFKPIGRRKCGYSSQLPYAAQTFSGINDRVVSMAWVRLQNARGNYRGVMSLPTELSLLKEGTDYRICFSPARELNHMENEYIQLFQDLDSSVPGNTDVWKSLDSDRILPSGEAVEILLQTDGNTEGEWILKLGKNMVQLDFSEGLISVVDTETHQYQTRATFCPKQPQKIQIIIDQEILEIFADNGKIYGMAEMEENILGMEWKAGISKGLKVSCKWCILK